jgi:hypothetical protein
MEKVTKTIIALSIVLIFTARLLVPVLADQGFGGGWGSSDRAGWLSAYLHKLIFLGTWSFETGRSVDRSTSPWTIVQPTTSFTDQQPVYALATLRDVLEACTVRIEFVDRSTNVIVYSYTQAVPSPQSQGYAYWFWYSTYAFHNPRSAGNYAAKLYVDNVLKTTIYYTITSTAPPPTPTPTPTPQICTPYQYRCSGIQRERCAASGEYWYVMETCVYQCSGGYCVAAPTPTPTPTSTPTPTPTPTPSKTPTPTPTLTPVPTPTPKPNLPGFEAGFAIAGLLTLTFLLKKHRG